MSSFRCKFCNGWFQWSPEGKLVHEDGSIHSCPKAPWVLKRQGRIRARAARIQELRKIDDHVLLSEIRDKIRHWNNRLGNYVLDLHVNKKFPEGEET